MKLETKTHDVAANGMLAQRKFTVDAGAHIMAVLSGLYKNPVDAMVREYLTNMYDAYVALRRVNPSAAITAPQIKVPSALDANLTFTDYGIGMSLDTVWNVYSSYGSSTKNGDNNEVGGFGLGSKTAFCYNGGASWSIVSRYEGQAHTFMAFIGEDGVPNLTHVNSSPTDEHSGLTISIPILRNDFNAVATAVQKYAPYFPMELTVLGTIVPKITKIAEGSSWYMLASADNRHHRREEQMTVVMGNVPYVVDRGMISNAVPRNNYDFFSYNSITVHVPIGSVDIVPSRDNMKYTEKTIKAISEALQVVIKEIGGVVAKQLLNCKTEWEAVLAYRNIKNIYGLTAIAPTVTWQKTKLSYEYVVRTLDALKAIDPTFDVTMYAITDSYHATPDVTPQPPELFAHVTDPTYFIIDDMPKGGALMARALLFDKCINKLANGRAARHGHIRGKAYLLNTALTPDRLCQIFGGMPATMVTSTSILKGTTPVHQSLKVTKDTIYRWSGSSWDARVNIPVVPAGTIMYYLPLSKDTNRSTRFMWAGNRNSQKDSIMDLMDAAREVNLSITNVLYGVKTDDVANLGPEWKNAAEAVSELMVKKINTLGPLVTLSATGVSRYEVALIDLITNCKLESEHQLFNEAVVQYNAIRTAGQNPTVRLTRRLGRSYPDVNTAMDNLMQKHAAESLKLENLVNSIKTKFPMFHAVAVFAEGDYSRSRSVTQVKSQLLDYIRSTR